MNITKKLFDRLKAGFPSGELLVIDQMLRMYTEPMIELDVPLLQEHLAWVRANKQALIDKLGTGGADLTTLMSNDQFAEYLKSLGVLLQDRQGLH